MNTPYNWIMANRAVYVSLGIYGLLSHQEAITLALAHPPIDPLLGTLYTTELQLCPQNSGKVDLALACSLRSVYPDIRFRLHANVRLENRLRIVNLSDWPQERSWFAQCAIVSHALRGKAYTAHAGMRVTATLKQVLRYTLEVEQLFGIPVGIEGHYPTLHDTWLLNSWEEYRQLLESGVHYVLDLSHLNILVAKSGRVETALVVDLLASPQCLEVHVSGNDGSRDQHLPLELESPPWWLSLLGNAHHDAVIFSEGRQNRIR